MDTGQSGKVTGDGSWRGWGAGRLCMVEGGRGECGRQKPHGSLSRAGWQGATASEAKAEEEEGSCRQRHFPGLTLWRAPVADLARML